MKDWNSAWQEVPTPSYVISEPLLKRNLEILAAVQQETGAKILLAQKCFSMYSFYPMIGTYLSGTTASGLYEARLGKEEMGKENHVFSPAYREEDMDEIAELCDHVIFNSFRQLEKFAPLVRAKGHSCGLRVNPEHSTQEHAIYDPCSPGSRMGVRVGLFERTVRERPEFLTLLDGLHMHTLCEQGAEALSETIEALEAKFSRWLPKMKWLNLGGGHHITKAGYDLELLKKCIRHLQTAYGVEVYLEPGEAVALNAGHLVATVLELQPLETEGEGIRNVILDTSAACHMPDVMEMPYRPPVVGSGEAGEKQYTYRFGGPTCLAGDIIGEYSFDEPLEEGSRIIFDDMAIYTMVKNNTFNGMPLPQIISVDGKQEWKIVRAFGYEDFKSRL